MKKGRKAFKSNKEYFNCRFYSCQESIIEFMKFGNNDYITFFTRKYHKGICSFRQWSNDSFNKIRGKVVNKCFMAYFKKIGEL